MKLPALPKRAAPTPHTTERDSAQQWVAGRVRAVRDGLLVRGDGTPLGVVRVEPAPLGLLSERERGVRVAGLHEALHAVDGSYQMVSVQRPVDLDQYLGHLEDAVRDAAGPQQRALAREYRDYVRGVAGGGDAREQRHYVLLGPDPAQRRGWKEADARKAAGDLVAALGRAGLTGQVPEAQEIVDLLGTYLQPGRRADEPLVEPARFTVWGGGGA